MARLFARTIIPVTPISTTPKTVFLAIAPANQRVTLDFEIGTDATTGTVLVQGIRYTGSGSLTAATPIKIPNVGSEAVQTAFKTQVTAGTEPPSSGAVVAFTKTLQAGESYRLGKTYLMAGGEIFGIACSSSTGTPNVSGIVDTEE